MGFFDLFRTTYSKEQLLNIVKNDRRILREDFIKKAKVISRKTEDFMWSMEREGTSKVEEVANGIYKITLNGIISGIDA